MCVRGDGVMEKDLWQIVKKDVEDNIGDPLNLISYLEHLIDLQSLLILKLSDAIEPTLLDTQTKELLGYLGQFNVLSSVEWNDLSNPFQAYKIPVALEKKKYIRDIQRIYLEARLKEEGLI